VHFKYVETLADLQQPRNHLHVFIDSAKCPPLALSGHRDRAEPYPLSGVKRTLD
jgi:hypothetical protein